MKSSCAPYNNCKGGDKKTKKKYLFNPNNPKKSFDVYVDKKKKQYQLADKYYSFKKKELNLKIMLIEKN